MRWGILAVALCGVVGVVSGDVAAAKPKHGTRPPLVHRYDFNQDGKINTMERVNSRMMKAQQREWRAVRRNDALVR